jgi:hypothetical protein
MDIYTGRPLWEAKLPAVGKFYDNTAHQPGANAAGSNFVSLADGIYVAYGQKCVVLDNASGEIKREIPLPKLLEGPNTIWSFISAPGNYLVGGAATAADPDSRTPDSKHVFVMERATGKLLWSAEARHGFRNNTICVGNGRLFAIDRFTPRKKEEKAPADAKSRLAAFELATGKPVWSNEAEIFGTWLSISEEHDMLVESGTGARDSLFDEAKGMRAYKAKDGSVLWTNKAAVGPGMIRGTMLLQGAGALQLLTGENYETPDPVSGGTRVFKWARTYGCNTPAAGQHLLTFRSGMAGFFNLERMGGTGNIGGIRSGCTNNLIQAGGILCAPDYTRTCTCSYHLQTSIGLVNDAETEEWTYMGYDDAIGKIARIGVNLGAPGDRVDDSGTMWLEHPANPSKSPKLAVVTAPNSPPVFRKHASAISGEMPWVAASGLRGLSSLTIPLGNAAARKYTVKLYFVEPDGLKPTQRLIDVTLQGTSVLKGLDIAKEAGGPDRSLIREFKGIAAAETLVVGLTATTADQTTVLCGVEVKAE